MAHEERQYSCEFFPPRTDKGRDSWREALTGLVKLKPAYFSCTYGAGGTTQEGTADTLKEILAAGFPAAAHITCIGSSEDKIRDLLAQYRTMGVNRLVALRGDLPEGMADPGVFHYADELISFIRKETDDEFHIEIAAYPEKHPEAESLQKDMANFKKKAIAGADSAITQYFFNTDAYFRFVDSLQDMGVDIPIVPGIMPITNHKQIVRFSDACGAEIPRWIHQRMESYGDDMDSVRKFGIEVVTQLCQTLLDSGAPGIHFYTMNQVEPTREIYNNLGL